MTAQVSSVSPLLKGKKNGYYYKISFYTVPEHVYSHTYINRENNNFERWEKIIDAPHGIYVSNLRWKDEANRVIDADSKVIFKNVKYEKRNPIDQLTLGF